MSHDCEKQWEGLPIEHLILSTDDFVVFLDKQLDVDWKTTSEYDKKSNPSKEFRKIMNLAASIETIPCNNISKDNKTNFKRLVAESIARCLEHDYINAKDILTKAENFILSRNKEVSRFWYLSSSLICGTIISITGLLAWIYRTDIIYLYGKNFLTIFLSFAAGSVGALLSIIMRLGKLNLDCSSEKKLHVAEGVSRIIAGAISGIIGCLAVKAGYIMATIGSISEQYWNILLIALLFGSSERLAPSIISKAEVSSQHLNKKSTPSVHSNQENHTEEEE